MPPGRRWTIGHGVALVELACAVVGAAWLVVLGVQAGAALLFVAAAVLGVGLTVRAVRTWRAADQEPVPAPGRRTGPSWPPPAVAPTPLPPLSTADERELDRVVDVLFDAGVFAPEPPDLHDLRDSVAESVARWGGPVTAEAVLRAVGEADHVYPGYDPARHEANLAFHDSHAEQFAETVHGHVADLVRLAGGGLDDVTATVEDERVRLVVDGAVREVERGDHPKYLSAAVHAELAAVLRARATGRRLAWTWCDQGVWISGLPDGGADRLNAALGPAAGEGWSWVDEQPGS